MGLEPHSLAREVAVGTGAKLEWKALSLFEGGLASPLEAPPLYGDSLRGNTPPTPPGRGFEPHGKCL